MIGEKLNWFWTGSEAMSEVLEQLQKLSALQIPVLIIGETGSGKELIARKLWELRCQQLSCTRIEVPFVPVNVSTIPESLAESLLFGHERGAFTSARERQIGHFERAKRGTLFLDEIQSMNPTLQCKLLRVVQNRELDRLGARTSVSINCQIVAASSIPLEILCREGLFRKDLFYRLNTFPIYLPPLRKRKYEFEKILHAFLSESLPRHQITPKNFDPQSLDLLQEHQWSGNFRELEHTLIYCHLKSKEKTIRPHDLPPHLSGDTERYLNEFMPEGGRLS